MNLPYFVVRVEPRGFPRHAGPAGAQLKVRQRDCSASSSQCKVITTALLGSFKLKAICNFNKFLPTIFDDGEGKGSSIVMHVNKLPVFVVR